MTDEVWENEFTDHCVREMRSFLDEDHKDDYQVLILDGFVSHTSTFRALRRFLDAKIFLISLPSHTSADLQPLDLTIFGPAKSKTDSEYRKHARFYFQNDGDPVIHDWELPGIIYKGFKAAATTENIVSRFRKAGVFPFRRPTIDDEMFLGSLLFFKSEDTETVWMKINLVE